MARSFHNGISCYITTVRIAVATQISPLYSPGGANVHLPRQHGSRCGVHASLHPKQHLVCSSVFAKLTSETNTQTDTQTERKTDRQTTLHNDVRSNSPRLAQRADIARRQHLRSAGCHQMFVPRHRRSMFGRRAFSVAWNSLPDYLRDPSRSFDSFRRDLTTFLFSFY